MDTEMTTSQRKMLDLILSDTSARPVQVVAPIPGWDEGAYLFWQLGENEFEVDITPQGELGYLLVYHAGTSRETMRERDSVSVEQIFDLLHALREAMP